MGGVKSKNSEVNIDQAPNSALNSPRADDHVQINILNLKQNLRLENLDSKMILGRKRTNNTYKQMIGNEKSPSQSQSYLSGQKSPENINLEDSNRFKEKSKKSHRQQIFVARSQAKQDSRLSRFDDEVLQGEEELEDSAQRGKVNIFKKAAAKNNLLKQQALNKLREEGKQHAKSLINESLKNFEPTNKDIKVQVESRMSQLSDKINTQPQSTIDDNLQDFKSIETYDEQLNLKIQKILQKHAYIQYWNRGPDLDQKNQNLFVKNDKVIIIDEEEHKEENVQSLNPEDILGELIQQNINPIQFIIGDKTKIWEQMKAEEERVTKEKKEQETKKLIKKSDVRMTIYPAFDNFFQSNYKQQ